MNRSPKVLIVDDEPNVRLMLRTSLETSGYEVREASDGAEVLDRLRESRVDLILLDLRMPGVDGMETLRNLRAAGLGTPVVILTAHGTIPDAVAAVKLGAIDFLSKPLTPSALRKVVAEVIDRHAPPAVTPDEVPPPDRFAERMTRAKRALNLREFDEAAFFLDQAVKLDPASEDAVRLSGVLRESRLEHDGPYRVLRNRF